MTTRKKYCNDCRKDTDPPPEWCDICNTYICFDCGETHDCLAGMLDEDEEEHYALDELDDEKDFDHLFDLPNQPKKRPH